MRPFNEGLKPSSVIRPATARVIHSASIQPGNTTVPDRPGEINSKPQRQPITPKISPIPQPLGNSTGEGSSFKRPPATTPIEREEPFREGELPTPIAHPAFDTVDRALVPPSPASGRSHASPLFEPTTPVNSEPPDVISNTGETAAEQIFPPQPDSGKVTTESVPDADVAPVQMATNPPPEPADEAGEIAGSEVRASDVDKNIMISEPKPGGAGRELSTVETALIDPSFASDVERIRDQLVSQVDTAVKFFGSPPLLEPIPAILRDRLSLPAADIELDNFHPLTGLMDDMTNDRNSPTAYFVYEGAPGEPDIRVGFIEGPTPTSPPVVESIIYSQAKETPDTIFVTSVTIHGLAGRTYYDPLTRKMTSFLTSYYVPDKNGTLPPAGGFLEFRKYDAVSEELKARIYGTLQPNVGRERSIVYCQPSNKEIFPFIGDNISPEGFAMVVDNSLLVPMDKTLTDEFYSETLLNADIYAQAARKKGEKM